MGKKRSKPASHNQVTEALAVEILRKHWQRLIAADGVTSCGVGRRTKDGQRTDEICIQCTVQRKYSPETLQAREMRPLPEYVQDEDGNRVGVDVLEREYKLSHELVTPEKKVEDVNFHQLRRSRLDPMVPGISVSHIEGSAGTIGAIVFDNQSGQPLILSNWHVLQGPEGNIGDAVVQPGPFDESEVLRNRCGQLVRSHLGLAGDCAVASIDEREWREEILELAVAPARMARPNLDDRVVKSGRTTGVTYGIVERVNVVANLSYGGDAGVQAIGGFEIRPNPDKLPENGEISMGGDSGSVWMLDPEGDAETADVVMGLHFAGETNSAPDAEHALACLVTSVAEKLDISFEPPEEFVATDASLWREVFTRLHQLERQVQAQNRVQPHHACKCQGPSTDTAALDVDQPAPRAAAPEAGIPLHGNWCGPGHGGGTPIDALDVACMHHDGCYGEKGYLDCSCDRALVREIDHLLRRGGLSAGLRAKALLVRQYFCISPCVRYVRIAGRRVPLPALNRGCLPPVMSEAISELGFSSGSNPVGGRTWHLPCS